LSYSRLGIAARNATVKVCVHLIGERKGIIVRKTPKSEENRFRK